jgi:hypothetical protein
MAFSSPIKATGYAVMVANVAQPRWLQKQKFPIGQPSIAGLLAASPIPKLCGRGRFYRPREPRLGRRRTHSTPLRDVFRRISPTSKACEMVIVGEF